VYGCIEVVCVDVFWKIEGGRTVDVEEVESVFIAFWFRKE
jgi:hypothetical protein